jgi:hypothetical protein
MLLLLQVANSKTVTASAQPGHVAVPSTESLPALACQGLTKRQILEKGASSIDAALGETVQGLKKHGYGEKATRVLVLLAQAYGDNLKAALSDGLQVGPQSPHLLEFPHSLTLAAWGVACLNKSD